MDYPDYNTNHQKGKHLRKEDYFLIQIRLKDGWKANRIAKEIGCAPNTVRNAVRRGQVSLYHGKVTRFKAAAGWKQYLENRRNCGRKIDAVDKRQFLLYVEHQVKEEHWSLDACAGSAIMDGRFSREQTVCTRTLYRYIDLGLLPVKSIDLPSRVKRKTKHARIAKYKQKLGRSIEERPDQVDSRQEFGHWEIDLVIGGKSKEDNVLLTMIERKTRNSFVLRLPDKSADSVQLAFRKFREDLGDKFSRIFRTITTDNGHEFSRLSELEKDTETRVYFAHPYTSCEKGSIENFNGLIRRFIRKGRKISDYSTDAIFGVVMWANSLPRRILGYKTPEELFEDELNLIYAV